MRTEPPHTSLELVVAKVRESFLGAPCQLTFGIYIKGTTMFWRDSLTGETQSIANLPHHAEPIFIAVLDKLRRLRRVPQLLRRCG